MALKRGTLGQTQSFFPLTTGFTYRPYDEEKDSLSPEIRAAMEEGIAREKSLLRPPSLAVHRKLHESHEDYLERRVAADAGEPL